MTNNIQVTNNTEKDNASISEKFFFAFIYSLILFLPISFLSPIANNYVNTTELELFQKTFNYGVISVLVLLLTLVTLELLTKKKLNYLQYMLIGISVFVGFLLNLSIGEFTGFHPAFIISSFATIALNTSFTMVTSERIESTCAVFSSMLLSYITIYFLIQSSEYNLLFISIVSFILVAIAMFASHYLNNKK